MKIRFEKMVEADREAVIDLFNYYIENSFAAYPDKKVPYGLFDHFLKLTEGYPAFTTRDEEHEDRVVGFAFLRPYHPLSEFQRSAEITVFHRAGIHGQRGRFENPGADDWSCEAQGDRHDPRQRVLAQRIEPALPRAARFCGVRAIQAGREEKGAGCRCRLDAADPLKKGPGGRVQGTGQSKEVKEVGEVKEVIPDFNNYPIPIIPIPISKVLNQPVTVCCRRWRLIAEGVFE